MLTHLSVGHGLDLEVVRRAEAYFWELIDACLHRGSHTFKTV